MVVFIDKNHPIKFNFNRRAEADSGGDKRVIRDTSLIGGPRGQSPLNKEVCKGRGYFCQI